MNYLELGGCCLAPQGAASVFPSKAQQIMARFRPIAPKPVACTASNPAALPSDPPLLSSPSEGLPFHRPSKTKRCRKRRCSTGDGAGRTPKRVAVTNSSSNATNETAADIDAAHNRPCISSEISPYCRILVSGVMNSGGKVLQPQSKMMLEQDIRFLERADAASTPAFPERRITNGTPSVQVSAMACQEKDISAVEQPALASTFLERQINSGTPVKSLQGSGKLVTLHLLPDTPSRVDSFDESSPSCTSVTTLVSNISCDEMTVVSTSNCYGFPFLDQNYIQNVFGASSDPFILVDNSHRILWFNTAYDKAVKATAPLVNTLGFPTHFGTFKIPSSADAESSFATLWCFLKRIFTLDKNVTEPNSQPPPLTAAAPSVEGKKIGVITPRPKRLVGSTVSLESVMEVQLQVAGSSENMEEIEKELEEGTAPAFITDGSSKVRWVNTAYKKMVGQPECPWLASTVINGGNAKMERMPTLSSPSSSRLTGEVLLVGAGEKIPELAGAFSGRVNIQWANKGERSSMTVPCDVVRVCAKSGRSMFVWKFDVRASLRLTCGF